MFFKNKILPILQNPFFIALIALGLFMATTGYKYGWDDQHLEVPLLKKLIDNSLYPQDYYVEALKNNFTSYFYPLLAKIISIKQIPSTYFFLFLISRYFLFFWIYKLWLHITKKQYQAFICVFAFILLSRVNEFLYRTFSHQEFALAIIFAGIYYFFKNRFLLSAIILGIAANFHALYALFPFIFMETYLLLNIKEEGWQKIIKTSLVFFILTLPFLIWTLTARSTPSAYKILNYPDWKTLYIAACPQNFILPLIPISKLFSSVIIFFEATKEYLFIIALFLLNLFFNDKFKTNKKATTFCIGAFLLLLISVIFTYVYPTRFILDLNLIRNSQYLLFLLMGYTTILMITTVENEKILIGLCFGLLFVFLKYGVSISNFCSYQMILLLTLNHWIKNKPKNNLRTFILTVLGIFIILITYIIYRLFNINEFKFTAYFNLGIIFLLLIMVYFSHEFVKDNSLKNKIKKFIYIFPMIIFLYQYCSYYIERQRIEDTGLSFWKTQRSWEDMQRFVKDNTPKDSLILIPYDMEMCGFRIQSERSILVSYRDCGIVGFDYGAAQEWVRRIHDILPYKVSLDSTIGKALRTAITKYKVDYIIFMRYAAPRKQNVLFEKIYTNSEFVLYKVISGPGKTETFSLNR